MKDANPEYSRSNLSTPTDFYRFRHRVEYRKNHGNGTVTEMPLWIVGVSPFDPVISSEDGYVMHMGKPRFMARWSKYQETIQQIVETDPSSHLDEDLGIIIYDFSWVEGSAMDIKPWLLEAVCAIAYSRGEICELEPPEGLS